MAGQDEEEVVKLLFGDHPPQNWRENEEFLFYLTELGNLGKGWRIKNYGHNTKSRSY